MADATPAPQKRSAVFLRRLASTLALWALVGAGIWTRNQWLFFAVLAALGGLALIEWCRMLGGALPASMRRWLLTVSALYAGAVLWQTRLSGDGAIGAPEVAALVVLVLGLFGLAMRHAPAGRDTLWAIFAGTFGFLYIPLAFSFGWRLLLLPSWDGASVLPGVVYLVFVIAVTKFSDMGAYVIGMLFGRRKLIPHISPGKTWGGLGGAFLGAFVAAHGMVALWAAHLPLLNHVRAAFLAAGLGSVAVVADLAESVVKRCLGAKDSGHSLPGIGGVLDLLDSLLFTLPVGWVYLYWLAHR